MKYIQEDDTIYIKQGKTGSLINILKQEIDTIRTLNFSRLTADEMEEFVKTLQSRKYGESGVLDKRDFKYLNARAPIWEDRLNIDVKSRVVIYIDDDHNLNPQKLMTGAVAFFTKQAWESMSYISKRDLEEAVQCILFKQPTSAGIMSLRATEAELREFYSFKTSQASPTKMNWGNILNELNAKKVSKSLLGHLDFLRFSLRNKLNHPDSVLTQEEAEHIFAMIVTTIHEMRKEMV